VFPLRNSQQPIKQQIEFYCMLLLVLLLLHAFIASAHYPIVLHRSISIQGFMISGGSKRCFCVFHASQLHFTDQQDHRTFIGVTAESDKVHNTTKLA
jgi:hypothetical protein